jgi:hypothetical protein
MWRKPIHRLAYCILFNRAKKLKGVREYERRFLLKYLRTVKTKEDE